MSARVRSRSRGRRNVRKSSNPVEPVVAQQPGDKKSQEKPLTENLDIEPGQEREEGGASGVEEPELDVDSQELDVEEPEDKHGGGFDEKGKTPPKPSAC